jgi:hypothetical protein
MKTTALLACLLVGTMLLAGMALADNAPAPALTLPSAHWANGIDEYYMRIQDMPGPAMWPRHTDWFKVLWFDPHVTMPAVIGNEALPGSLRFVKKVDEFSHAFMLAIGGDWHQPYAVIKLVHHGKTAMTIKLHDVWIQEVQLGTGSHTAQATAFETITVSFGGLTVTPGGSTKLD